MAAVTCNICDWITSADRHTDAAIAADRHEAKAGHDDIEVC